MTGRWEKLGLLFDPQQFSLNGLLLSHASNPTAVHLYGDIFRVFYSGRDHLKRSSVGAVDIDIIKRKIVYVHKAPFFAYGHKDSFFSEGVSIGCIANLVNQHLMYFMGWRNKPNEHWYGQIGALIIDNNFNLHLYSDSPILSLSDASSLSLSYPCIHSKSIDLYEMYFGSTLTWNAGNNEMLHVLQQAESLDGINWKITDQFIPYSVGLAQAFSRPTFFSCADTNTDYLWFSYRSGTGISYRIGRAFRHQNDDWQLDLANPDISPSTSGWDSDMIEYPFTFEHRSNLYLLYNGNGYGLSGFGLAIWRHS